MKAEDVDNMQPGRELDALIHWHIFGYEYLPNVTENYSGDIAAAWLVVEKMLTQLPQGDIHIECLEGEWGVSTCHTEVAGWEYPTRADTAPLAICRASLKAHFAQQLPDEAIRLALESDEDSYYGIEPEPEEPKSLQQIRRETEEWLQKPSPILEAIRNKQQPTGEEK